MKILVVDDSPMQQKIARIYLEKEEGFVIFTAENGANGIKTAKKELPDLILLDVEMPDMQGDEALRLLKDDPATSHIPVIMCTSLGESEISGRINGLEVAGYLQKPHGFSGLRNTIRDIMKKLQPQ
jgi:DNA-binding response OmpR family regulator